MTTLLPEIRGFNLSIRNVRIRHGHSNSFFSFRPWRAPCGVRAGPRSFSAARVLRNQSQGTSITSQPKPPSPSSAAALARNLRSPNQSYVERLAQKSTPTTLYESPPQRGFLISSYAAGFTSVSAACVNVWINMLHPPEGTAVWVPFAFGASAFVLVCLGTFFALIPASIVRSIRILPSQAAVANARNVSASSMVKSATAAAAAVPSSAPPIQLEIAVRRFLPFPFLPLKRIKVEPQKVVMRSRLFSPGSSRPRTEEERRRRELEELERRKARREYELDHLMTAPFRDARSAVSTLYYSIRRGLSGEGFLPISVDGVTYKLDTSHAYVLDQGRALDRLVRIDEAGV